ncbi:FecR domain-containing protein [Luteolibacter algae]|uniref:FecR domain-containing protein n=1 Tax=Luteolibacter algae TaxID=454151 RepID=A0ABW5D944_9BACT
MKRYFLLSFALFAMSGVHAAPLKSAEITAVVNDVKISTDSSSAQTARIGEKLTVSSSVLTGRNSRAELTFDDQTITRVGANSIFRFSSGSRDMEIQQGSFLLNVPKNAGGATIRTATVTAAITGTTTMMEYSEGQWFKFLVIEGVAKLRNQNGDTIDVEPGNMIVMHPQAKNFPAPLVINLQKLVKTSKLLDGKFFKPLGGNAKQLIDHSIASQLDRRRVGKLLPTGVIVRGPGRPFGKPDRAGNKGPRTVLPRGDGHMGNNGSGPGNSCIDTQGMPIPGCDISGSDF